NADSGKKGREPVRTTAEFAMKATGCEQDEVYLASTGVIGEPLEAGKFQNLLDGLVTAARADSWARAARAIMTTDTYPKLATRKARIGNVEVSINGFCKG